MSVNFLDPHKWNWFLLDKFSVRKTKLLLPCRFLVLAFLLVVSGCDIIGRGRNLRPIDELASDTGASSADYTAKSGDILSVQIWGEPRLSGEVLIRDDGKFTLPLAGDIAVEGKSLEAINADITTRLKEFIPSVSVTISVLQSAPIRFYLSGQFLKPGEYRSDKKITLLQAIATGGGFAPFADESNVILIRKSSEGELRYSLDYNLIVDGREPNPILKGGDFISVK